MSTRHPGTNPSAFTAQPATVSDTTMQTKAPPPPPAPPPLSPALPRRPATGVMDLIDESEERTAITSTPPPSDQPGARDPEEATAVSTAPPPRAPGNVQYRPGSGAIALDALMRTSGVDRSEPSATPDPFEAAATIVGALPVGPEPSAWDEEAPTDVITLPPPRDE